MAAPCPTCGKDIDPLRAPAARVVGGRIVAYCSTACADQLPRAAGAVTLPSKRASTAPAARRSVTAPSAVVAIEMEADEPSIAIAKPRRRRRVVLALTAGIVVGGMAVAIVQAVSPSTPARVEAGPPAVDAGVLDAAPPRD